MLGIDIWARPLDKLSTCKNCNLFASVTILQFCWHRNTGFDYKLPHPSPNLSLLVKNVFISCKLCLLQLHSRDIELSEWSDEGKVFSIQYIGKINCLLILILPFIAESF